jgi:hypothetical protein
MPSKSLLSQSDYKKLVEANARIGEALVGIRDNLKQLNDVNILHAETEKLCNVQRQQEHQTIIDQLKTMTEKYWWLILVLIAALLAVTGYGQVAKLFAGGG